MDADLECKVFQFGECVDIAIVLTFCVNHVALITICKAVHWHKCATTTDEVANQAKCVAFFK